MPTHYDIWYDRLMAYRLEKAREKSANLQVLPDMQEQPKDASPPVAKETLDSTMTIQVECEDITPKCHIQARQLKKKKKKEKQKKEKIAADEEARLQHLDKVNQAEIEDLWDAYDREHRAAQQPQLNFIFVRCPWVS